MTQELKLLMIFNVSFSVPSMGYAEVTVWLCAVWRSLWHIGIVSISTDLKDKRMERKRILSEINLDTEMFMTSFDKAARLLTEQKEKLEKQGWTSVHLKMEYYYEGAELKAYGMRLENDAEFNKRKEAEEKKLKAAERKAERERKKYEELKLKYGE